MKKKIVAVVLSAVFLVGTLAGCGAKAADKEQDLLTAIKDKGTILIGTEGTYAPFTYHDETGALVGYDVEIAEAVAEKLGVKVEFVETNWDSLIAGLDAKRYDAVFNQVGITPERQEKYDFSTPYTVTRAALIVASDNDTITSFEDLKGKNAAQSLTSNYATLSESYGATITSTDGLFSKAIELIETGRADATINDELSFYDYVKQKPDAKIKIATTLDDASKNAVLIRKGNQTFVDAINKVLKELEDEGKLKEISEKYFGTNVSQ